jgi:hypothetical protein
MQKCRSIFFLLNLIIALSVSYSSAQSAQANTLKCINGKDAKGTKWITSFTQDTNSDLKRAYLEFKKEKEEENKRLSNEENDVPQNCNGIARPPLKKAINTTFKLMSTIFPQLALWETLTYYWEHLRYEKQQRNSIQENTQIIPKNSSKSSIINTICISEAMKNETGGNSVYCNTAIDKSSPEKKRLNKKIPDNSIKECIDDSMVDYISFSVNSAIQCFSESKTTDFGPLDSKLIFEKLTNESAFNYTLADPAKGISIGQLTSPAIRELSESKSGKAILAKLSESESKHCNGFKNVLDKPPSKIYTTDVCAWVSPGDGLARSLIYSIGYYLTLRDNYIIPQLKKFNSFAYDSADWAEAIKSATTAAYGREGIKFVKLKLSRLTPNSNARTINSALQTSAYIKEVANKKNDLYPRIQANFQRQVGSSEQPEGESLCFINYPNP